MMPCPIQYHVYRGQDLPPAKPYAYALAGNGVFKLADTAHFSAALRLASPRRPVAGLEELFAGMVLHVPRIPARWLRAVLADARRVGRGRGVLRPVEQMYHFHYFYHDPDDRLNGQGWRVERPRQEASAGRVTYQGGDAKTIVLDLHSHHEMAAFYSSTDNRDELGCRFYAVLGHIYSRPEIRLRLGVYGDFLDLPATALFEDLAGVEDCYDR